MAAPSHVELLEEFTSGKSLPNAMSFAKNLNPALWKILDLMNYFPPQMDNQLLHPVVQPFSYGTQQIQLPPTPALQLGPLTPLSILFWDSHQMKHW
jgi:hypothetical protein